MTRRYFVTGIGTDVGKTVACAVLAKHFSASYWKPIQCGLGENIDSATISNLTLGQIIVYPEAYRLNSALSPDIAARRDGVEIQLSKLICPETDKPLIIEGPGGALVPLNNSDFAIDLAKHLQAEVILVSRHYVGSINHTLLTLEALKNRAINIKGLVYIGSDPAANEESIARFYKVPVLARIPEVKRVGAEEIANWAASLL
jgi:dethiobiotin synthetase